MDSLLVIILKQIVEIFASFGLSDEATTLTTKMFYSMVDLIPNDSKT